MHKILSLIAMVVLTIGSVSISQAGSVSGEVADATKRVGKAVFSDVERRVIEEYMARRGIERERTREHHDDDDDNDDNGKKWKKHKNKGKHHKHAKGNSKGLPPGIQMKIARGGTLPPGIAKKGLPHDVESRLPPVREGYERHVSDGKVVLVESATGIITDVIDEVLGSESGGKREESDRRDRHVEKGESKRAAVSEKTLSDREPDNNRRVADSAESDDGDKRWWHFWK